METQSIGRKHSDFHIILPFTHEEKENRQLQFPGDAFVVQQSVYRQFAVLLEGIWIYLPSLPDNWLQ